MLESLGERLELSQENPKANLIFLGIGVWRTGFRGVGALRDRGFGFQGVVV